MKSKLIQIGNSKGIRIPKSLIEQFNLHHEVELDLLPEGVLIRSSHPPRMGWSEAFQRMNKNKDDILLDKSSLTNKWDQDEWEW